MKRTLFVTPKRRDVHTLYSETKKMHLQKKLRQGSIWVLCAILTFAVLGWLTHWGVQAAIRCLVMDNPRYNLTEIEIEVQGSLQKRDVLRASHIEKGMGLMKIDLHQVQHDIEKMPYVAEAEVSRHLPNKIKIRVTERIPMARWTCPASATRMREVFTIDREGVLIRSRSNEQQTLPEIIGFKLADPEPGQKVESNEVLAAIQLLKYMERTSLRSVMNVHSIDVSSSYTLQVVSGEGMVALFRTTVIDQQLERLGKIIEISRQKENPIATVDLTLDRNVPVTFVNRGEM
ncbi:MAG: FtsQ-type POTRA domain-containing protein [Verrucomicrobiota bacterium]